MIIACGVAAFGLPLDALFHVCAALLSVGGLGFLRMVAFLRPSQWWGRTFLGLLLVCGLSGCASLPKLHTAPVSPTLLATQRLVVIESTDGQRDWDVYGEDHAAHYVRLVSWSEEHNIVVAEAALQRRNLLGHTGRAAFLGWVVLVDRDLPTNNRLYTLVHELGHVFGPDTPSVQEDETVAELVAVQVCDRWGLNVWHQTAAYLRAHVTSEVQLAVAMRWGTDIDNVVVKLAGKR